MNKNLYNIFIGLTIIGAINWGLVGLLRFNLVEAIFGIDTSLSRIIYSLVGISGLYVAAYKFINVQKNG